MLYFIDIYQIGKISPVRFPFQASIHYLFREKSTPAANEVWEWTIQSGTQLGFKHEALTDVIEFNTSDSFPL